LLLWNVSKDKKTGLDDNPLENNKDWIQLIEFCLDPKLNQKLDTKVEIGSRKLAVEIGSRNWQ